MNVKPKLTSLSGNEIYCLRLKGLTPSGVVVGNSVQSMGFIGSVRSSFRGVVGGEIPDVTQMIHEGREAAFKRLQAEAGREGVRGVVGVTSELRQFGGNSEFLFVGSGVHASQGTVYSLGAVGGLKAAFRSKPKWVRPWVSGRSG